jgi:hypothetical protein
VVERNTTFWSGNLESHKVVYMAENIHWVICPLSQAPRVVWDQHVGFTCNRTVIRQTLLRRANVAYSTCSYVSHNFRTDIISEDLDQSARFCRQAKHQPKRQADSQDRRDITIFNPTTGSTSDRQGLAFDLCVGYLARVCGVYFLLLRCVIL